MTSFGMRMFTRADREQRGKRADVLSVPVLTREADKFIKNDYGDYLKNLGRGHD